MGGEGSGRKPDVMKMAKEQFQNNSVEFEEVPLILPNYSGIQKAALKTGANLTAGSVLFAGANRQIAQDNTNLFWDDSNNRLGIGTTSPDEHLEVEGTGTQRIQVIKTDATVGSSKLSVSSTGGFVGSKDNILFQIGTNDQGVIAINGSNVGIGTTSPDYKLDVFVTTNNGIKISSDTIDANTLLTFQESAIDAMSIIYRGVGNEM